jgi:hypothetical protein
MINFIMRYRILSTAELFLEPGGCIVNGPADPPELRQGQHFETHVIDTCKATAGENFLPNIFPVNFINN